VPAVCGKAAEHREQEHVHAGAVATPRGAALFLGRAGSGKSSLTFTWCWQGAPALGDDVVLLDSHGCAHAIKRCSNWIPDFWKRPAFRPPRRR
jgi:serine kinase of HPr protein (carbohydrate metabolism regulator)